MNRDELKRRIGELTELVMHEENAKQLLEYLIELDKLIELYRGPPSQRSVFAEVAMRVYQPRQLDVEWARSAVSLITDGGLLIFPQANLRYRVDHQHKVLTLINIDQLRMFDSFITHLQTISTFSVIDYAVIELKTNGGV
jgi:hypothetical protein